MLMSLVAIMAFLPYMTDGTLMQPLNLTNLAAAEQLHSSFMALGMLALVIVAGHIGPVRSESVGRLHRAAMAAGADAVEVLT